jgi:hypothetical protein
LASIAIPLAFTFIGLLINRSIQRQNAIAQRQSSWLTKWADDFLKSASGFNESVTSFIMACYKTSDSLPGADNAMKQLHREVALIFLEIQRWDWEIQKYAAFAPKNGKDLQEAATALTDEIRSWSENKGGNVQEFLTKQVSFNTNARNVHAELLGLRDSKDRHSWF